MKHGQINTLLQIKAVWFQRSNSFIPESSPGYLNRMSITTRKVKPRAIRTIVSHRQNHVGLVVGPLRRNWL